MTEVKEKVSVDIKTIPRPMNETLGTLIELVEADSGSIDDLSELAIAINTKFHIKVDENMLMDFYEVPIRVLRNELLYKQYGY
jgi:hypothetical protein